ncbi:hypothetical protein HYR99_15970 [Candidatus Poribacteria bacterium]|nr:hypothetical protein [Candidatus Poribacteria bacterium]
MEKTINLWIDDRSPNWQMSMNLGNIDISILTSYILKRNWKAKLNLITTVSNPEYIAQAEGFMNRLVELSRLPKDTKIDVVNNNFDSFLNETPHGDLNIFSLSDEINFENIRKIVSQLRASCIFTVDSGLENVLA